MKSVIFCASQRFAKELLEFMDRLRALTPPEQSITIFHPHFERDPLPELMSLTESERMKHEAYRRTVAGSILRHNRLIRKAQVCFIFNKNRYIGYNTFGELVAAAERDKIVYALEKPIMVGRYPNEMYEEPVANEYVDDFVPTPEALIKFLI